MRTGSISNTLSTLLLSTILITAMAQDDNLLADKEKVVHEFHVLVKSMPSPIEELEALRNDHEKFNENLLCPAANIKLHETDAALALNCGVYMVDFAYMAVHHKQDHMMEYRALALEMADKLDAAGPFHDVLAVDLEKKVKDHAALKKLIDEALYATEEGMLDSNHLATASQLLIGSWVETQYIVLQSFKQDKKPHKLVKEYIMDQQKHLANLINLVHEFRDEAGLHDELGRLNMLEGSFKKIHSLDEVNDEIVAELTDEITRLRMDITAME